MTGAMWWVFRKDLASFFHHVSGYLVLGLFQTVSALFLFVFPDTSILEGGFASLEPFFERAPILFLFLVPALTMRLLAEERQRGTLVLLLTRPLTSGEIIAGKFLASVTLLFLALLPTALYAYTLYALGSPPGNLDLGAILTSWIGLLLLGAVFASVGIFASSLTHNQVVAFLLATTGCFALFHGFDFLSALPIFFGKWDALVQQVGMAHHYHALSRGAVDTRDLLYFASLTALFLGGTRYVLEYPLREKDG